MVKIRVQTLFCVLEGADAKLSSALQKKFRFRKPNWDFVKQLVGSKCVCPDAR